MGGNATPESTDGTEKHSVESRVEADAELSPLVGTVSDIVYCKGLSLHRPSP